MPTNAIQVSMQQVGRVIKNNSPTILTALGVAGLLSTVALAVKATPKALAILRTEEIQREIEFSITTPLTKAETIQLTWQLYIPAAAVGAATIACIIGANSINLRRNAALVSLYTITERAMQEYQAKVVETIGKNKEEKLKSELNQDTLDANPLSKNTVIITNKGKTLCYDSLSGRYFESDMETIRRIQNDYNKSLMTDMYKSLNELYDELGLEGTKMGSSSGWILEHGMLEINFDAKLAEDGQPCIMLNYRNGPRII